MSSNNNLVNKILRDPYIYLLLFCIILSIIYFCAYNPIELSKSYLSKLLDENTNFTVSCFSGTLAFLFLLPCSKSINIKLIVACFAVEICYMLFCTSEYTALGRMLNMGPPSFALCIIAAIYLACTDKDGIALRIVDIIGLALVMPVVAMFSFQFIKDPHVYDWMLLKAETLYLFQPCFLVTFSLRSSFALQVFMLLVYTYLPLWIMLAQIIVYKNDLLESKDLNKSPGIPALSYLAILFFGLMCYTYYPAVGPQSFLGSELFPNGVLPYILPDDVRIVSFPLEHSRNCMPSLHLTWILCAFFSVYNLLSSRYVLLWLVLVILTLGSAFSVGCHWTTDFFVALPFTAFCLGLTWHRLPKWRRLSLVSFGGLATYGMMFILKYHIVWCVKNAFCYNLLIFSIDVSAIVGIMYGLAYMRRDSQ